MALPVGVGGSGPSRSRGLCPCAAGEATVAAALLWNKSSRFLPRPVGVPLRRHRRACGGGAPHVERLYRGPASFLIRLRRAAEVRGFCSWATEQAGVLVGVWRLDLPRSFLGGGGRRRRRQIQGLQGLGRRSGRRTTADDFFYCDSNQSHGAKGPLQLAVELVFLGGGDGGGRRGNRLLVDREGSRDLGVIFSFLGSLA